MTFSPITSWQIDGETIETVTDFIFLGSKITADGDCSHKIKKYLLLGRKTMTNIDSILKSRDITLLTKVRLVKAMFFPVVIYTSLFGIYLGGGRQSNPLQYSCLENLHGQRSLAGYIS